MNFSSLCTILVTFGPETPEFMLLTIAPFVVILETHHPGYRTLRHIATRLSVKIKRLKKHNRRFAVS